MTKEHIEELLKGIKYPGYSRDIVSFGLVKEVACNHGAVSVAIELTGGNDEIAATIKHEVETLLRQTDGVDLKTSKPWQASNESLPWPAEREGSASQRSRSTWPVPCITSGFA